MSADNLYNPPESFSNSAHVSSMEQYHQLHKEATETPEEFWAKFAEERLHWFSKWSQTLQWDPPFAKWFVGGKTNISYNCLDRHLATPRKNKAAIIWEGEPGDERVLTYQELYRQVAPFRQCAEEAGPQGRGPRDHLHADDSRASGRDARLRQTRHYP